MYKIALIALIGSASAVQKHSQQKLIIQSYVQKMKTSYQKLHEQIDQLEQEKGVTLKGAQDTVAELSYNALKAIDHQKADCSEQLDDKTCGKIPDIEHRMDILGSKVPAL